MRQIGTVTETNTSTASVAVHRMSACEGCHKSNPGTMTNGTVTYSACHECSMFPRETEMSVTAENPVCARVGDRVILETASETILSYAAAVFLLPPVLAFVGGIVAAFHTDASWGMYLGAVLGFIGAFVFVKAVVDRHAREKTVYTIVKILTAKERYATQHDTNEVKTEAVDH